VEITGTLPPQATRSADAQFWVQFEIAVPRGYSVEVNTDAGDITTGDIGGTASLHTQGGNIKTGRIGSSGIRDASWGRFAAKVETEGGHIQVLDVAGDLTAFTGGGHINVGNIAGDASLRTGGGHIRAGQIGGRAELETAGGNITVAHAGSFVSVKTGGGQIDFGEVRGSVHAQTGGGGIRVMYVSARWSWNRAAAASALRGWRAHCRRPRPVARLRPGSIRIRLPVAEMCGSRALRSFLPETATSSYFCAESRRKHRGHRGQRGRAPHRGGSRVAHDDAGVRQWFRFRPWDGRLAWWRRTAQIKNYEWKNSS